MQSFDEEANCCPLCDGTDKSCPFNFPTIKDFQEDGKLAHVKLPIVANEPIPEDALKFIYGAHYNGRAEIKPRNIFIIRNSLNELLDAL